jgi:hypothetical protein
MVLVLHFLLLLQPLRSVQLLLVLPLRSYCIAHWSSLRL